MARLIRGGRAALNHIAYGDMSDEAYAYVESRLSSITERYGDTDETRAFQSRLMERYEHDRFVSRSLVENNFEYAGGMFDDKVFVPKDVNAFRSLNNRMQEYIIAHPHFANEIKQGRLSGWSRPKNSISDLGENNPHYQAAIDGLIQYGDEHLDGIERECKFEIFSLDEDAPKLKFNEQLIMRETFNKLMNLIEEGGEDPTSPEGGYL